MHETSLLPVRTLRGHGVGPPERKERKKNISDKNQEENINDKNQNQEEKKYCDKNIFGNEEHVIIASLT